MRQPYGRNTRGFRQWRGRTLCRFNCKEQAGSQRTPPSSQKPFLPPWYLTLKRWSSWRQCTGKRGREGSACQQQVLVHPSGSRQQAGYWCVAERGGLAIWCGMVQRLDRQIEKGFRFRCLDRTSRYQNQPNLACFKTQEHVVTFEDLCLGRPAFFWLWSLWLECYQASAAPRMQFPTGHCCNPIILLLPLGLAFELRNWPLAPRQNAWTTGFVLVVSLFAKCWGYFSFVIFSNVLLLKHFLYVQRDDY